MIWGLITAAVAAILFGTKKQIEKEEVKTKTVREEFIEKFQIAAKAVDFRGLPPKFVLAVADLETGGGSQNSVYAKTNNAFSITKGSSWFGPVYKASSGLEFRVYKTLQDSIFDFVRLMHIPIYRDALAAALANDIKGFGTALKKAGYDASEPQYASLIVERFNNLKETVV